MRSLLLVIALVSSLAAADVRVVDATSSAQFDDLVATAKADGMVVVADFHAEWCGPCKQLSPILADLASTHAGKLVVVKVDVDQVTDLAQRFQAVNLPYLIKFKDGKQVDTKLGLMTKEQLTAWLGL